MKLVMEPQKQYFTLAYVQFNLDIKYMFPGKRRTLNNYSMLSKQAITRKLTHTIPLAVLRYVVLL